jgi:hypothetical protein
MALPVTELLDLTEIAEPLGIKCQVGMFASLAEDVEAARTLERFRDALVATERDPLLAPMRAVVLHGEPRQFPTTHESYEDMRRFLVRARAGIGGVSDAGDIVALAVAGRHRLVHVLFTLWRRPQLPAGEPPSLVISSVDNAFPAADLDDLGDPGR